MQIGIQIYLWITQKSFNFYLILDLNILLVIFTLYFDVENVQKSSLKYDENDISMLWKAHMYRSFKTVNK